MRVTYNIINWSSVPTSNLDSLKVSTKKAVLTILFSKNKLRRESYMWKIKNNLVPISLTSWFQIHESIIIYHHKHWHHISTPDTPTT